MASNQQHTRTEIKETRGSKPNSQAMLKKIKMTHPAGAKQDLSVLPGRDSLIVTEKYMILTFMKRGRASYEVRASVQSHTKP